MKKLIFALPNIITFFVFFLYLNVSIFADGIEEVEVEVEVEVKQGSTENIPQAQIIPFQETIPVSQFRDRPDIILQSYLLAYPDIMKEVIEVAGDWALEMQDGSLFYWANGRLLPPVKKDSWEDYRSYQIYPYRGVSRNPDLYTSEEVERLRQRTTSEVRGAPQLPQDETFLNTLFSVSTRASTEEHIVKTILFGKQVSVHEKLVPKLDLIDAEVASLAQTDSKVAEFLETLSEVSGYNWRTVAGTNRRSNHSYGLAIDVLPKNWGSKAMYWEWISDFNDDWMLVPQDELWTPPETVIEIFKSHGFIWGGTWDIYDTMHFEYKPELVELSKRIIFD